MPEGTPGAVWLRGRVIDGAGEPVPDALVETWQIPAPTGPRLRPLRHRRRRAGTRSCTVKPGPVPGPDGTTQAPHLAMSVFARGLLDRVVTRVYFADEADANAADPVLASVADAGAPGYADRRERDDDGYRLRHPLQGEGETVFLRLTSGAR